MENVTDNDAEDETQVMNADKEVNDKKEQEDEKENEDVKVAEQDEREDEKKAEDGKVAEEGENKDRKEADDEKVAGKEQQVEKEEGDGKKYDENEQDGDKVAEEGEKADEKGQEYVKMEEGEKENEKEDNKGEMEEESKSVEMEGDVDKITKNEDMVEVIEKERKPDKPKVGKGTKRPRANNSVEKSDTDKKRKTERESVTPSEKEVIPKTHTPSFMDRPVRERKSVERLVAIIEKDSKDFHIEKGRGTALKDIPNVAYKLSKKKNEDTFKLLHTILFARREKAAQIKNNISRFSGFVWHGNEEKQMIKVKEKLDKCVKEKLLVLCDILDIPVSKTRSRKEDVIGKLIEFFMEPHASTSKLIPEKEQFSKGKKRKRASGSAPGSCTSPSKGSSSKSWMKTKSTPKKSGGAKSSQSESDEDKQEMDEEKDVIGVREISGDEVSEKAESEEKQCESEQELDEDKGKKKQVSEKSFAKKRSASKPKTMEVKFSKKASPPPKKSLPKSPKSDPRKKDDKSGKKSSGKKKEDEPTKKSTPKELAKESIGKKLLKVRDKYRENKSGPSDDELRNAISEILKEVDFNTATFTDILKLLVKQFNADLTPRKSLIKSMIQDELTKLSEEDEDEDDGANKDEKKTIN